MPYLTRDGVRLYYADHGPGLPVLLSHGFGVSTDMVARAGRGFAEVVKQAIQTFLKQL